MHFGETVFRGVGPLIETVEGTYPETVHRETSSAVETDLGQSPWRTGIAGEVFFQPSGSGHAGLVNQGGRGSVVPNRGCGAVNVCGVEVIHEAVAIAVYRCRGVWYIEDAK